MWAVICLIAVRWSDTREGPAWFRWIVTEKKAALATEGWKTTRIDLLCGDLMIFDVIWSHLIILIWFHFFQYNLD